MDVSVSPISTLRLTSSSKCKPGTSAVYKQNSYSSFTPPPPKRTSSSNKLLLVSNKVSNKPRVFLKVSPDIQSVQGNKGFSRNKNVMLYQQIERDKSFSGNAELVNRFNYKV